MDHSHNGMLQEDQCNSHSYMKHLTKYVTLRDCTQQIQVYELLRNTKTPSMMCEISAQNAARDAVALLFSPCFFPLVRFDYNIHVHRGHGHLIYMFSELKLTFTLIDFILTVGTIESRKALTSETAVTTFTSSVVTVNGPAVVVKIVLTLTAIKSCMEMK